MKIIFSKKHLLFLIICLSAFALKAQKLPSVQTASVPAPPNIKIDGRATEWDNKFQAYNTHIECFYTLSNDANNVYLTLQATNSGILRRIINGGITFAVNKSGKKNNKESVSVTFPIFDNNNRFTPQFRNKSLARLGAPVVVSNSGGGGGMSGIFVGGSSVAMSGSSMPDLTPAQADSLMRANNTSFAAKAKSIGIKGIVGLDSLISVYNEDGIKATAAFDSKFVYTYELCVPIKSIGLDVNSAEKFSYHVIINEVEQHGINIVGDASDPSKIKSINITSGAQMGQDATDFWGEYRLAKP